MFNQNVVHAEGALGSVSGVASALPGGANLGDERIHQGVVYRLFYNAGNSQISKGRGFKYSTTVGNGVNSVTVSTVTETVTQVMGAVVHATVATGQYFWGAVRSQGGTVSLLVSNVSIATGALIMPAADGNFTLTATSTVAVGRNQGATATTDAVGGQFHIFFNELPKA